VFALLVLLQRALSRYLDPLPPAQVWQAVFNAVVYGCIAVFAPWLLLSGRVSVRRLLPSGVAFAVVMLVVGPVSRVYLRRALVTSAERFGPIGIAFTYLTWLYVLSFALLATAVLGQVVSGDQGWLGRWIRGHDDTRATSVAPDGAAEPSPAE
jgi:membrane protein